jgi:hypothetical protein
MIAPTGRDAMNAKLVMGAALLCAICSWGQAAPAQHRVQVVQNVEYVICTPKPATVGRCIVQEPVGPCPASSAEAYPKQKFATVQRACAEARKRDECRGGLSGC